MSEISKLIFNELASRRAITLPEVGVLWVEFRGGESEDHTPMNTLLFSREIDHNAISILDVIQSKGSMDDESAEQSYSNWLANHTSEGGIEIDGVGRIFDSSITPSNELTALLNPIDEGEEESDDEHDNEEREGRYSRIWIALIILFVLILAGGWGWWWHNRANAEKVKPQIEVIEPTLESSEQLEGVDSTLVEGAVKGVGKSVLSKKGEALYHVLGGIFSIESNANRYVAQMKRDHPEYECEIRAYRGGRFAVSLFRSVDERGAVNARNRIVNVLGDEEIWVYRME